MTRLEIMTESKRRYTETFKKIETMQEGLEKVVAEQIILPWIKGTNWLGGLPDSKANKIYDRIEKTYGYDFDTVHDEFLRQIETFS